MFGRSSRSSSKNRSTESISTLADEYIGYDEAGGRIDPQEKLNLNLTNTELKMLLKESEQKHEIEKTLNNPLGKLLIKLTNNYNCNLPPTEPGIQLNEVCEAFQQGMNLNRTEINKVIQEANASLKSDLYRKELNFHLINPLIKPPESYSETNVLLNTSKSVEAVKLFPQNKSRFSGIPGDGPAIAEYMHAINYAQNTLNLSKEEFKQKLLNSCTGPAHRLLRTLIAEGDDIPALYHKLICLYDPTPDPSHAKAELTKFKISKKSSLMKAQGRILELASAAARIFQEGPLRRTFSNAEAIQCLIRALPKISSALVSTQYNILLSKQEDPKEPVLFVDLVLFLNKYKQDIDDDIKNNRTAFESNIPRERRFTPNVNSYKPYRPMQVHANFAQQQVTRSRTPIRYQPERKLTVHSMTNRIQPQNRFLNKMFCSLCGKDNHLSSMGCYSIKKNGVVVPCSPTQIPCYICEKKVNKKLYHPPTLCFNKDDKPRYEEKRMNLKQRY